MFLLSEKYVSDCELISFFVLVFVSSSEVLVLAFGLVYYNSL